MKQSLQEKLTEIESEVGSHRFTSWVNEGRDYVKKLTAPPKNIQLENEIIYNKVLCCYIAYKGEQISETLRGVGE